MLVLHVSLQRLLYLLFGLSSHASEDERVADNIRAGGNANNGPIIYEVRDHDDVKNAPRERVPSKTCGCENI